jgi:hypothetical protein
MIFNMLRHTTVVFAATLRGFGRAAISVPYWPFLVPEGTLARMPKWQWPLEPK